MPFTPDAFRNDWYGYITNQSSHTFKVGFLLITYGMTVFWYLVFGEFPYKWLIISFAAVGYLSYELAFQGWHGWDTLQDWWYVVVYGVVAPVATFTEVEVGQPYFSGSIMAALPFVIVYTAHITIGTLLRYFKWIS